MAKWQPLRFQKSVPSGLLVRIKLGVVNQPEWRNGNRCGLNEFLQNEPDNENSLIRCPSGLEGSTPFSGISLLVV